LALSASKVAIERCLVAEGGDDGVAAVHLGDVTVERPERRLLLHEELLRPLGDAGDDDQAQWQRQDDAECQQPADGQHHHDHTDQRQHRRQKLREVLLQGAADAVQVVDRAAHHFAAGSRVEELERQAIELGLDLLAQRVHGLLRHVGHQVLHDVLKHVGHDIQDHQARQDAANAGKVDPGARGAGGLRHEALENLRRGEAQDLRAEDAEHRADRAGSDDDRERRPVRPQVAEQADQRALEVLGLLRGDAQSAHRTSAEHRRRRARRCGRGRLGA
jgi:hypothetical protein